MGLDLTVIAKPLPGHEEEFRRLLIALSVDAGIMTDPDAAPFSKFGRFLRLLVGVEGLSDAKRQQMADRFNAIGLPGYANLGAPRVGESALADSWLREGFVAQTPGATSQQIEDALAAAQGHYALPLVPGPCDGLPVYSNGQYGHVDETSFRGAFLDECGDVLTAEERAMVWQVMFADQLATFGHLLRAKARDFADRKGVSQVIGIHRANWTEAGSAEAQAHIVDSLGRWAIFWGEKGHGCQPDF